MNGKDKMLGAMTTGLRSDFPVVIPYVGIFLRDHWDEITDQPWWITYSTDLSAHLKVEEDLLSKLDLDWIQCGMCPPKEWRESHTVKTQGGHVFLTNTLSGEQKEIQRQPVSGAHIPIEKEPLINSVQEADEQIEVAKERALVEKGQLDYVKMVVEKFGSEKFICASLGSPYWVALDGYFGFTGMMINLFRKPELVEHTLERLTALSIEVLRAYSKSRVDGVWLEECLSSASEISLSQFERFVLPYTTKLISETRRLGMKSIFYPCGDVSDRLELMIEAGPDCISLEESKKGFEIDLDSVDEVVAGRTCIFGNLDAIRVLPYATSIELRKEIRRQVNIGRRHGKFVMSLGSPVTPQTPTSRVREYVDIVREESG